LVLNIYKNNIDNIYNIYNMPPPTSSVSQSVSAVTLTVSSGSPSTSVSQTFSDSATLASLQIGSNSIPVTNQAILTRFATPGLQCSNTLSLAYGGLSTVATPALVNNFVATPLILSNFGPFTYSYVSGGVGTFTLPQPSSNGSSPGAFTYSVVGSTGVVSVSSNVVTMIAAGSTTVRATQAAAGGYASAYVEASVTINPIAPTFSNGGVFTISSKNFGDAPFTPSYPTSNSSGAFTYSVVDSTGVVSISNNVVTILSAGTTTIRATQAAAGGYTSGYVEASFVVTTPPLMFDANGVTIKYTRSSIPSVPYFIQASPRGTLEWFAVVDNTSKSMIQDYANNLSSSAGRTYFTTSGNVVPFNNIVTTLVTNTYRMFAYTSFNQNISSWDTSNVTAMNAMFLAASVFNQPIGSWNVSKVTDMWDMFNGASAFNQNISSWNVANVTQRYNFSHDSPLTLANSPPWNQLTAVSPYLVTVKYTGAALSTVPKFLYENPRGTGFEWFAVVNNSSKSMITHYAKNLSGGAGRTYFTPPGQSAVPFNNIVTTLVTDMSEMFMNASSFNENIISWDTLNVTNMDLMFSAAFSFNSPIGYWNTSNVTNMNAMFSVAYEFNQYIKSWDVTKVSPKPPTYFSNSSALTFANSPVWV
jgi:surface protein